jgi:hypothetical protein
MDITTSTRSLRTGTVSDDANWRLDNVARTAHSLFQPETTTSVKFMQQRGGHPSNSNVGFSMAKTGDRTGKEFLVLYWILRISGKGDFIKG